MNIDENVSFDSTSDSIEPLPLPKVSQNSNRRIPGWVKKNSSVKILTDEFFHQGASIELSFV